MSVKNWFVRASNCSKRLTSVTNRVLFFCLACLWFIDHTHSTGQCWCYCACSSSVLERVVKSQNSFGSRVLQYYATVATERAGYVLFRALATRFAHNWSMRSLLALYSSTKQCSCSMSVFRTIFFCLVCWLAWKKKGAHIRCSQCAAVAVCVYMAPTSVAWLISILCFAGQLSMQLQCKQAVALKCIIQFRYSQRLSVYIVT